MPDPKRDYGKTRKRTCFDIFFRGQAVLMTNCVAQKLLGSWLEIFLIHLESYSMEFEVIMGADRNELKHFRTVLFKGSK